MCMCRRRNAELLCKKKNTNWTRQFHAWSVDAIKCVRWTTQACVHRKSEFNRRGEERECLFFSDVQFSFSTFRETKVLLACLDFPLMNSLPDQHFYLGGEGRKCSHARKGGKSQVNTPSTGFVARTNFPR